MKRAPFFYNFETDKLGLTFADILQAVESGEPFKFTRWGDGEWSNVLNVDGVNVDLCKYLPEQGQRLREILTSNPEYFLGVQDFALASMGAAIQDYLQKNNLSIFWHDADIIHKAAFRGELWELFQTLAGKKVLLIGAEYQKAMQDFFEFEHLVIPERDCYLHHSEIMERLNSVSADVYLYCSGMAANIQIHETTQAGVHIDVGAAFDPFCGRASRVYHRKIDILKLNGYV